MLVDMTTGLHPAESLDIMSQELDKNLVPVRENWEKSSTVETLVPSLLALAPQTSGPISSNAGHMFLGILVWVCVSG